MTTPHRTRVGLVVIGDEVLSARVAEANAVYLLGAMRDRGFEVVEVVFVRDRIDAIAEAVLRQDTRCDLVITTGGIGPTHDDLTVAALAHAFGVPIIEHPDILAALARMGPMNEGRQRLARVPEGATLHWGRRIPWPVARLGKVYMFPGVPEFVRALFEDLQTSLPAATPRTALTLELAVEESTICLELDRLVTDHGDVAIGSYPRRESGAWRLRLTFEATDPDLATRARDDAATRFAAWIRD
jgi:molybdenum cofactor synthesis domain-containing protein